MSTERKYLSNREWILIVSVVVASEYIFLDKVLRYGSDGAVVSYVSFAGTIVSIILAALAIVYSYYQNFSQQRDSNNVAAQINLLRSTVSDVRVSKNEFINELQRISDISDKLDQSISILSESKSYVADLHSSFNDFRLSFEGTSMSPIDSPAAEQLSAKQIEYLFFRLTDGAYVVLYALYKSRKEELELYPRFNKYYLEPAKPYWTEFENIDSLMWGSFLATKSIIESLGLVREYNNRIEINAELEPLIQEHIEKSDIVNAEGYKEMLDEIKKM
jgi:hypothetical protein